MPRTFVDLLSDLGVVRAVHGQHHHARKGWVQFDCPFCSAGSGRFRMGYNERGGYTNCWTCGKHGAGETVAKLAGVPYREACLLLKGLTPTKYKDERQKRGRLVLPGGLRPLLPPHKAYLRGRGFNVRLLSRLWHLQGIGNSTQLRWRIFIPAYLGRDVVSWTTRSISENSGAKYLTARPEQEAVSIKEILYGEEYCRHAVVVNEGPMDAWAVGPGAVATCGVGYSVSQLLRISQYPVRVIMFDNEPDAQRRADKLCADLAVFDGETHCVTLDTGKDASRADKKEIEQVRKSFLGE